MIEAGINEGDTVIVKKTQIPQITVKLLWL